MAGTVAGMTAYIRARIELGTLEPGDRLPPTKNLMHQFNLSDNAVYRAVALLKAEGLVVSRQGKGVFVADRRALIARLFDELGGEQRQLQLSGPALEQLAALGGTGGRR